MKPWSHLPNASLIDWVIESLKCNPELWSRAEDAVLNATRDAAYDEAWAEALDNVRSEAWDTARDVTWYAAYDEACDAAHGAILALVAYDDCDQYLQMSYDQLLIYATLSERPQAVLLLPLKWVQEHEALVTST